MIPIITVSGNTLSQAIGQKLSFLVDVCVPIKCPNCNINTIGPFSVISMSPGGCLVCKGSGQAYSKERRVHSGIVQCFSIDEDGIVATMQDIGDNIIEVDINDLFPDDDTATMQLYLNQNIPNGNLKILIEKGADICVI